jgi:hypothetical protein
MALSASVQSRKKMLPEIIEKADLAVVESPMHGALFIRDFELDSRKVIALGKGYEPDYSLMLLRGSLLL